MAKGVREQSGTWHENNTTARLVYASAEIGKTTTNLQQKHTTTTPQRALKEEMKKIAKIALPQR